MISINPAQLVSFASSLEKDAGIATGVRALARRYAPRGIYPAAQAALTGTYSRQLASGAAAGAGMGLAGAEEGEGLKRMLQGAALGAGAVGGRALATKAGREAAGKGLRRFGTRQKYFFTGRGLGKGKTPSTRKAKEVGVLPKKPSKHDIEALKKGHYSIPGVAKGLVTKPGETIKGGWRRSGKLGKAFAGLGAYETGRAAFGKHDPRGPSRTSRVLGAGASTLGWVVAPPGMLAATAMGEGAGAVGRGVGRLISRKKPRLQPRLPQYQEVYQ